MRQSIRARVGASTAAMLAGIALVSGCGRDEEQSPPAPPVDGQSLAAAVGGDAVAAHMEALERIAADNGGNRAAGTAGYDASVDYVADRLRDAGFEVSTPEFDVDRFIAGPVELRAGDRQFTAGTLEYSPPTPPEGITARTLALPDDGSPGCEATDYDGRDAASAIVVVRRGVCPFSTKEQMAADHGAVAVVVFNNEDGPLAGGTLGEDTDPRIPAVSVPGSEGPAVAAAPELSLKLEAVTEAATSRNVIAQTTTGSTENVVLVGAHLDSVEKGPGINDNGSGSAAVLETALRLGSAPNVTNAVRFAWWGAEELGLVGSERYAEGLDEGEREDIALYLNFDMLGSRNAGYFALDGDDSDREGAGPGPQGSDAIERTLTGYLAWRGIAPDGTDFDGRSDYGPFIEMGIPSGGVDSGADDRKSEEQAVKWGGTAGETFDPGYHSPEDTLANVDRAALAQNAAAVAFGVGTYANSVDGPDGVPARADRAKAREGAGQ
ncbi:M28 family peptidase [Rhodococcus maanshanensis]|uniref:M28 family peptidase n=1 Tax=Rhodococcus maanshanensis TaxID=183556 RepID=UPI0022B56C45|nr:M28 family peptidase [Rhodococcus maanshanensis]MCZ4555001.1 M28 family peptidase [Rhodococcus maanshanensis]